MSAAEFLNRLGRAEALETLLRCCGSSAWASKMETLRPFASDQTLLEAADESWSHATQADILEAFTHHPKIGASMSALREKFASTANWSAGEQASVAESSEEVLERLRDGNIAYEKRFGFIFIVCATGKTASEMLDLLEARLNNSPEDEIRIAAGEQGKITKIRLEKLT